MSKVKVPGRSLWYTTHRLMVMHPYQISLTYPIRNHYLTLRSKVKVQQRSLWYATHHLMDMHPHTKYHWPISNETFIWPWGQRSRSNKGHYGMQHTTLWTCTTYQISLTYLERNNYLTFRSNVKVQTKVFMVLDTPLVVMHPHTKYHWPFSKDKKCYGPNKKILFKKQLFDLEVKGQDPTVIMVCNTPPYGHAPTYQISLTSRKKQLFELEVKGQGPNKGHYGTRHTSYGHAPTYQISLTNLERQKMLWPKQENTI
jgi:hypothetical protein